MPNMPKNVFEDGLHYVRPVTKADKHKMRWVAKSAKGASKKLDRHCPTKEDAIRTAKEYTRLAIARSPSDAAMVEAFKAAATIQAQEEQAAEDVRTGTVTLQKFATTHFNCIRANPVAQVWQCISIPGERKPAGRKGKGGRAPEQTAFNHNKGDCAVLKWKTPIRNEDGSVRVFRTWQEAESFAEDLYYAEDEENRVSWTPDHRVVASTLNLEVCFDPECNGASRPFNLYYPHGDHPHPIMGAGRVKNYVTDPKMADGSNFHARTAEERAMLDALKRQKALAHSETRELTTEVLRFRTIWQAAQHAQIMERDHFRSDIEYQFYEEDAA